MILSRDYGDTTGAHPELTEVVLAEMTGVDISTYPSGDRSDQYKAAMKTACEQYLACLFISGACYVRCGAMKRYVQNEYLKDKYAQPNTFETDIKYMNGYQMMDNTGG